MNSDFSIAVHCIAFLATKPDQRATSEEIAHSVTIHPARLRKILSLLRKEGLLSSKEGIGGGFLLKEEPGNITLDKIFFLTSEGVLKPKCPEANENCMVGKNLSVVLYHIFDGAEAYLMNYLKTISILDIINEIKRK
ncbi:RrF2 family transcriptional regulator [Bacillus songklensis]|uniref:RrF2 family transcriptional regulator n=1 Tax=Bacillus songklensis TaxID=1069116 RepID=A0ABV8B1V0_9BACI